MTDVISSPFWKWLADNYGVLVFVGGGYGSLLMMLFTVRDTKARVTALENERDADHDLLIEMRNDVKWIKERMR